MEGQLQLIYTKSESEVHVGCEMFLVDRADKSQAELTADVMSLRSSLFGFTIFVPESVLHVL